MSYLVTDLVSRASEAETKLLEIEAQLKKLSKTSAASENSIQGSDIKGIKFYYWPIKNRGNFGRMLLAEANVDFEDICDPKQIASKCKCKNALQPHDRRFDAFAPPFLEHDGHIVSQTVAIQMYLGEITGLRPKSNVDNILALNILENSNDLLSELGKRKNDNAEQLKEFLEGRFQTWCEVLALPLHHGSNKSDFYFDCKLTYVDVFVACLFDGIHEMLGPKLYDVFVTSKHPALETLYQKVVTRPRIAKLLKKQTEEGKVWIPDSFFKEMKETLAKIEAGLVGEKVVA